MKKKLTGNQKFKLSSSDYKKLAEREFINYNKKYSGKYADVNEYINKKYGGYDKYKPDLEYV